MDVFNICFLMLLLKLLLMLQLLNFGTVKSQTYEDATNLRSILLSGYHKDIRPINNQSNALNVNITMILYGMPEVDDVRGVVKITVVTQALWMDERISWNPSDHGGISKIPIPMNEVWTPSISLATPVEFTVMGSSQFYVTFHYTGLALFFPGAVLESSCIFNMRFWPFDKQVCDVGFFPLNYRTDDILFSIPSDGINTESYSPNAEWTLDDTNFYIGVTSGFSVAFFKLKLKRQYMFYVLTIILPINGIIGLTCLVFLLPSESGERVSYAITIMLSLAVFLTVVSAEIPKTSEPISLMCCYILAGVAVSVIGTVAAILNLIIHHRNEDIPKRRFYLFLVHLSRCKRDNRVRDEAEAINDSNNTSHTDSSRQSTVKPIKRLASKRNVIAVKPFRSELEVITWHDISHTFDKLLFYITVFGAYIPSVCFLIYLGAASDYEQL